jgi:hypothetical protein
MSCGYGAKHNIVFTFKKSCCVRPSVDFDRSTDFSKRSMFRPMDSATIDWVENFR